MSPMHPVLRRRALGYRLLGRGFDYLLHMRPAEWPIMTAHTAVGLLLALGSAADPSSIALLRPLSSPLVRWGGGDGGEWWLGLILWVVCLNGGTLALNSAVDKDTSDVAYLRFPPVPPRHLFGFGLGLMLLGLVLSLALPIAFRLAYLVCLTLSVLYSTPPWRLKAVAGADWFVNMWGFGTLTPYAGWAVTGRPLTPTGAALLLGFAPLFGALYPLTQLYQLGEDRARGDRTLALGLGARGSLTAALVAAGIAFGLFALAGLKAAWSGPDTHWRWGALLVAAGAWLAVLLPWWFRAEGMTAREHQRGMYRALVAWAVTDVAVLYGFAR